MAAVLPIYDLSVVSHTARTRQNMHAGLPKFEAALTQAEKLTQSAAPPTDVFRLLVDGLRQLEAIPHCALWLKGDTDCRQLMCDGAATQESPEHHELIHTAIAAEPFCDLLETATTTQSEFGDTILKAMSLSNENTLALEVRLPAEATASDLVADASAAVLDCLSTSVCRELLNLSQRHVSATQSLATLTHLFYQQATEHDQQRVLVDELRSVLNIERICLLSRPADGQWQLTAASGADPVDTGTADSVAVEQATELFETQECFDRWVSADSADVKNAECLQTLKLHGVEQVFVSAPVLSQETGRDFALLLQDYSSPSPPLETTLLATKHSETLLQNGFRSPPGWRRTFSRRLNILWGLIALAVVLMCWRTDFEIEVSGQAFPQNRARVFAPADGVVESLMVKNGTEVVSGADLLTIRSEDLNLALQQTRGRLRVENTRLMAAERGRGLTSTSDSGRPISEAAIQRAIDDLIIQETMLSDRLQELSIKSLVAGTIVRANLRDELESRPVRRGQVLFEIVPSETPWQLELMIPDHLSGYVRAQSKVAPEGPRVRFYPRMFPEQSLEARLTEVDPYIQRRDSLHFCEGRVVIPDNAIEYRTPGMSVTARIDCGRSSVAFVWFRELLEFFREQKFVWF